MSSLSWPSLVCILSIIVGIYAYRVHNPEHGPPEESPVFVPYARGFVGKEYDPDNPRRLRVNPGNPFSLAQPNIYRSVLPRQSCPGMTDPIEGVYYCTHPEAGYCDRRSGACFCHDGYQGSACELCRPTHRRDPVDGLCKRKQMCPNDCSGGGVCDNATGVCKCEPHRKGVDCSLQYCRLFDRWCTSCTKEECASCEKGYYHETTSEKCVPCTVFDPRCTDCTENGCSICTDPLLNSVRRSGRRRQDPPLPWDEDSRELHHHQPFGTKDPSFFDTAESYLLIYDYFSAEKRGLRRSALNFAEACLSALSLDEDVLFTPSPPLFPNDYGTPSHTSTGDKHFVTIAVSSMAEKNAVGVDSGGLPQLYTIDCTPLSYMDSYYGYGPGGEGLEGPVRGAMPGSSLSPKVYPPGIVSVDDGSTAVKVNGQGPPVESRLIDMTADLLTFEDLQDFLNELIKEREELCTGPLPPATTYEDLGCDEDLDSPRKWYDRFMSFPGGVWPLVTGPGIDTVRYKDYEGYRRDFVRGDLNTADPDGTFEYHLPRNYYTRRLLEFVQSEDFQSQKFRNNTTRTAKPRVLFTPTALNIPDNSPSSTTNLVMGVPPNPHDTAKLLNTPFIPYLNASALACEQGIENSAKWYCSPTRISHLVCGHPGSISFSSPNYVTVEGFGDGYLPITITRSGGGLGRVTVQLQLVHGTTDDSDVSLSTDYAHAAGGSDGGYPTRSLIFEEGVVSLTVQLRIFDDLLLEPMATASGDFGDSLEFDANTGFLNSIPPWYEGEAADLPEILNSMGLAAMTPNIAALAAGTGAESAFSRDGVQSQRSGSYAGVQWLDDLYESHVRVSELDSLARTTGTLSVLGTVPSASTVHPERTLTSISKGARYHWLKDIERLDYLKNRAELLRLHAQANGDSRLGARLFNTTYSRDTQTTVGGSISARDVHFDWHKSLSPHEWFSLRLVAPCCGATLGTVSEARVAIVDDDLFRANPQSTEVLPVALNSAAQAALEAHTAEEKGYSTFVLNGVTFPVTQYFPDYSESRPGSSGASAGNLLAPVPPSILLDALLRKNMGSTFVPAPAADTGYSWPAFAMAGAPASVLVVPRTAYGEGIEPDVRFAALHMNSLNAPDIFPLEDPGSGRWFVRVTALSPPATVSDDTAESNSPLASNLYAALRSRLDTILKSLYSIQQENLITFKPGVVGGEERENPFVVWEDEVADESHVEEARIYREIIEDPSTATAVAIYLSLSILNAEHYGSSGYQPLPIEDQKLLEHLTQTSSHADDIQRVVQTFCASIPTTSSASLCRNIENYLLYLRGGPGDLLSRLILARFGSGSTSLGSASSFETVEAEAVYGGSVLSLAYPTAPSHHETYAKPVDGVSYVATLVPTVSGLASVSVLHAKPGGLKAEYFGNPYLHGTPMLTRVDKHVNFTWGLSPIFSISKCQSCDSTATSMLGFSSRRRQYGIEDVDSLQPGACSDWAAGGSDFATNTTGTQFLVNAPGTARDSTDPYHTPLQKERTKFASQAHTSTCQKGSFSDFVSVRWSGKLNVPEGEAGEYVFALHANDGVRLWIDGSLIIDAWAGGATGEDWDTNSPYGSGVQSRIFTGPGDSKGHSASPKRSPKSLPGKEEFDLTPASLLFPGMGRKPNTATDSVLDGQTSCRFVKVNGDGTPGIPKARKTHALDIDVLCVSGTPSEDLDALHSNGDATTATLMKSARTDRLWTKPADQLPELYPWADSSLRSMGSLLEEANAMGLLNQADQAVTGLRSPKVLLQENRMYDIVLEYRTGRGFASCRLSWITPSMASDPTPILPATIPSKYLYSLRHASKSPFLTYIRPGPAWTDGSPSLSVFGDEGFTSTDAVLAPPVQQDLDHAFESLHSLLADRSVCSDAVAGNPCILTSEPFSGSSGMGGSFVQGSGLFQAVVGVPATFHATARDAYGNLRTGTAREDSWWMETRLVLPDPTISIEIAQNGVPGSPIQHILRLVPRPLVAAREENLKQRVTKLDVQYVNGEASHLVSYVPTVSGLFSLSTLVRNDWTTYSHTRGSPHVLRVKPGTVSAAHSQVWGSGVHPAAGGTANGITAVSTRGGFFSFDITTPLHGVAGLRAGDPYVTVVHPRDKFGNPVLIWPKKPFRNVPGSGHPTVGAGGIVVLNSQDELPDYVPKLEVRAKRVGSSDPALQAKILALAIPLFAADDAKNWDDSQFANANPESPWTGTTVEAFGTTIELTADILASIPLTPKRGQSAGATWTKSPLASTNAYTHAVLYIAVYVPTVADEYKVSVLYRKPIPGSSAPQFEHVGLSPYPVLIPPGESAAPRTTIEPYVHTLTDHQALAPNTLAIPPTTHGHDRTELFHYPYVEPIVFTLALRDEFGNNRVHKSMLRYVPTPIIGRGELVSDVFGHNAAYIEDPYVLSSLPLNFVVGSSVPLPVTASFPSETIPDIAALQAEVYVEWVSHTAWGPREFRRDCDIEYVHPGSGTITATCDCEGIVCNLHAFISGFEIEGSPFPYSRPPSPELAASTSSLWGSSLVLSQAGYPMESFVQVRDKFGNAYRDTPSDKPLAALDVKETLSLRMRRIGGIETDQIEIAPGPCSRSLFQAWDEILTPAVRLATTSIGVEGSPSFDPVPYAPTTPDQLAMDEDLRELICFGEWTWSNALGNVFPLKTVEDSTFPMLYKKKRITDTGIPLLPKITPIDPEEAYIGLLEGRITIAQATELYPEPTPIDSIPDLRYTPSFIYPSYPASWPVSHVRSSTLFQEVLKLWEGVDVENADALISQVVSSGAESAGPEALVGAAFSPIRTAAQLFALLSSPVSEAYDTRVTSADYDDPWIGPAFVIPEDSSRSPYSERASRLDAAQSIGPEAVDELLRTRTYFEENLLEHRGTVVNTLTEYIRVELDHSAFTAFRLSDIVTTPLPSTNAGLFKLLHTPLRTGVYEVTVFVNDEPVGGQPFLTTVVPGPLDPYSSVVAGPGTSRAVAGVPSSFHITCRDRFGNRCQRHSFDIPFLSVYTVPVEDSNGVALTTEMQKENMRYLRPLPLSISPGTIGFINVPTFAGLHRVDVEFLEYNKGIAVEYYLGEESPLLVRQPPPMSHCVTRGSCPTFSASLPPPSLVATHSSIGLSIESKDVFSPPNGDAFMEDLSISSDFFARWYGYLRPVFQNDTVNPYFGSDVFETRKKNVVFEHELEERVTFIVLSKGGDVRVLLSQTPVVMPSVPDIEEFMGEIGSGSFEPHNPKEAIPKYYTLVDTENNIGVTSDYRTAGNEDLISTTASIVLRSGYYYRIYVTYRSSSMTVSSIGPPCSSGGCFLQIQMQSPSLTLQEGLFTDNPYVVTDNPFSSGKASTPLPTIPLAFLFPPKLVPVGGSPWYLTVAPDAASAVQSFVTPIPQPSVNQEALFAAAGLSHADYVRFGNDAGSLYVESAQFWPVASGVKKTFVLTVRDEFQNVRGENGENKGLGGSAANDSIVVWAMRYVKNAESGDDQEGVWVLEIPPNGFTLRYLGGGNWNIETSFMHFGRHQLFIAVNPSPERNIGVDSILPIYWETFAREDGSLAGNTPFNLEVAGVPLVPEAQKFPSSSPFLPSGALDRRSGFGANAFFESIQRTGTASLGIAIDWTDPPVLHVPEIAWHPWHLSYAHGANLTSATVGIPSSFNVQLVLESGDIAEGGKPIERATPVMRDLECRKYEGDIIEGSLPLAEEAFIMLQELSHLARQGLLHGEEYEKYQILLSILPVASVGLPLPRNGETTATSCGPIVVLSRVSSLPTQLVMRPVGSTAANAQYTDWLTIHSPAATLSPPPVWTPNFEAPMYSTTTRNGTVSTRRISRFSISNVYRVTDVGGYKVEYFSELSGVYQVHLLIGGYWSKNSPYTLTILPSQPNGPMSNIFISYPIISAIVPHSDPTDLLPLPTGIPAYILPERTCFSGACERNKGKVFFPAGLDYDYGINSVSEEVRLKFNNLLAQYHVQHGLQTPLQVARPREPVFRLPLGLGAALDLVLTAGQRIWEEIETTYHHALPICRGAVVSGLIVPFLDAPTLSFVREVCASIQKYPQVLEGKVNKASFAPEVPPLTPALSAFSSSLHQERHPSVVLPIAVQLNDFTGAPIRDEEDGGTYIYSRLRPLQNQEPYEFVPILPELGTLSSASPLVRESPFNRIRGYVDKTMENANVPTISFEFPLPPSLAYVDARISSIDGFETLLQQERDGISVSADLAPMLATAVPVVTEVMEGIIWQDKEAKNHAKMLFDDPTLHPFVTFRRMLRTNLQKVSGAYGLDVMLLLPSSSYGAPRGNAILQPGIPSHGFVARFWSSKHLMMESLSEFHQLEANWIGRGESSFVRQAVREFVPSETQVRRNPGTEPQEDAPFLTSTFSVVEDINWIQSQINTPVCDTPPLLARGLPIPGGCEMLSPVWTSNVNQNFTTGLWSGYLMPPKSAAYTLLAVCDGPCEVYVESTPPVNPWASMTRRFSNETNLPMLFAEKGTLAPLPPGLEEYTNLVSAVTTIPIPVQANQPFEVSIRLEQETVDAWALDGFGNVSGAKRTGPSQGRVGLFWKLNNENFEYVPLSAAFWGVEYVGPSPVPILAEVHLN